MIRKLIAVLLMLIGLVGVAAGVWGIYTVKTNDELTMALAMVGLTDLAPGRDDAGSALLNGAEAVLDAAGDAMDAIDKFFSDKLGKSLTDYANDLLGDSIDLTDQLSVKLSICQYRTQILLVGIILIQTGLLIWVCGRR